jgi:hypothetical protein
MKQNLLSAAKVAAIVKGKRFGWHHDGRGLYLVGSEKLERSRGRNASIHD